MQKDTPIKLSSGTQDKIYGDLIKSRLGLEIVKKRFYNPKICMQIHDKLWIEQKGMTFDHDFCYSYSLLLSINNIARIKNLFRPRFSKTLVLVISMVKKCITSRLIIKE